MITLRARRGRAGRAAVDRWRADAVPGTVYFTDGVDLYRVNRWLERPSEPRLAEIENCRSLNCVLLPCEDLARLSAWLIPVEAAAGA